jgi:hypothetical protein
MRKRLISSPRESPSDSGGEWLDLERLAVIEVSSEDPEHPIEQALLPRNGGGWRSSSPGPQSIRVLFDQPQKIRRIRLVFTESAAERTQAFTLSWSGDSGQSYREIVRQQWNFSRAGSTREVEDYKVDLSNVSALELSIEPDITSGNAGASLTELRLA